MTPGSQCFPCLSACLPVSPGNQSLSFRLLVALACWPLGQASPSSISEATSLEFPGVFQEVLGGSRSQKSGYSQLPGT